MVVVAAEVGVDHPIRCHLPCSGCLGCVAAVAKWVWVSGLWWRSGLIWVVGLAEGADLGCGFGEVGF